MIFCSRWQCDGKPTLFTNCTVRSGSLTRKRRRKESLPQQETRKTPGRNNMVYKAVQRKRMCDSSKIGSHPHCNGYAKNAFWEKLHEAKINMSAVQIHRPCTLQERSSNQSVKHSCWLCQEELSSKELLLAHYQNHITFEEPST
ncbi:uncharacterized protein [Montipora foliosa]|uniref:uncharacterized protein isoform X5 n=1 Tax=Montipora foliosa TaxID=591990 RepID=UPI0035F1C6FF